MDVRVEHGRVVEVEPVLVGQLGKRLLGMGQRVAAAQVGDDQATRGYWRRICLISAMFSGWPKPIRLRHVQHHARAPAASSTSKCSCGRNWKMLASRYLSRLDGSWSGINE